MITSSELRSILEANGFEPFEVEGKVGLLRIDVDLLYELGQCLPGHKTPSIAYYGDGTVTVVFAQVWSDEDEDDAERVWKAKSSEASPKENK